MPVKARDDSHEYALRSSKDVGAPQIEFRRLEAQDVRRVYEWRSRPHVARWWRSLESLAAAEAKYLPRIAGEQPAEVFLICLDERPIGMIQWYRVEDWPAYWPVSCEPGVAGVDLLIGEEELTGRGLGPAVLRAFMRKVVFAQDDVETCIADPDVDNVAAIRAFEKAGFERSVVFDRPDAQTRYQLVRLNR